MPTLSVELARSIMQDARPHADIAAAYGVCRDTVSLIKRRRIWKEATQELVRASAFVRDNFDAYWRYDPSGCWIWTGGIDKDGYGRGFRAEGSRKPGAHCFAYERTYGAIPLGLFVLHSCDNPRCVNPEHLSLGTHADNMADMMRKGRNAALNPDWRAKIRARTESATWRANNVAHLAHVREKRWGKPWQGAV